MARTKRKVNPVLTVATPTEQPRRIYRTGGYVRLSVEDSGKPGADTISAQKGLVLEYIEAQSDMRFCGLFCDNGQTGTNFDRPEFERLMESVRTGQIDCIVVKDLSRFGRNYKETGNYLERIFPFLDVRFVAVNDHFDTMTAVRSADGYIIPLKNIMNEVYSKDISRKIIPALSTKQQNGEFIGSWAPYGYRKDPLDHHHLEPDEETMPVVRMIFQWRLSGVSYLQIARRLNEQNIPSPSKYHYLKAEAKSERFANTVWHVAIIKRILFSEVYLGHMVQGRNRNDLSRGKRMCQVPKSDWIVVRNTHEAIIDEETFQAVQKMAEECRITYQDSLGRYDSLGTIPNILRGLVFCADCKRPMVRYKCASPTCRTVSYVYICLTHMENPASCSNKNLHETELKELLWDTIQRELALAGALEKQIRQHSRSVAVRNYEASHKQEIVTVRKSLDRAEMLYDRLFQDYTDKLMTEREYTELRTQYRSDIEDARTRLEELEQQHQDQLYKTTKNPWLTTCSQFQAESELTEDMAHALIERIEVDGANHVSVTLRYQDEYRALVQLMEESGEAVSA